jgi:hypothetical protein
VYLGDTVRISADDTSELGLVSKTWFDFENAPEEDSTSEQLLGIVSRDF